MAPEHHDESDTAAPRQDNFTRFIMVLICGLVGSGVVAIWAMHSSITRLEVQTGAQLEAIRAITADVRTLDASMRDLKTAVSIDAMRITNVENKIQRHLNSNGGRTPP